MYGCMNGFNQLLELHILFKLKKIRIVLIDMTCRYNTCEQMHLTNSLHLNLVIVL